MAERAFGKSLHLPHRPDASASAEEKAAGSFSTGLAGQVAATLGNRVPEASSSMLTLPPMQTGGENHRVSVNPETSPPPSPPCRPHASGHASRCQALEAPPRPTIQPADLIYSSRTSGTCVRTVGARLGARPWPERTSCERVGCTLLSATAAATSLEPESAVRGSYPHRGGRREDNLVVSKTSDVDGACDVG